MSSHVSLGQETGQGTGQESSAALSAHTAAVTSATSLQASSSGRPVDVSTTCTYAATALGLDVGHRVAHPVDPAVLVRHLRARRQAGGARPRSAPVPAGSPASPPSRAGPPAAAARGRPSAVARSAAVNSKVSPASRAAWSSMPRSSTESRAPGVGEHACGRGDPDLLEHEVRREVRRPDDHAAYEPADRHPVPHASQTSSSLSSACGTVNGRSVQGRGEVVVDADRPVEVEASLLAGDVGRHQHGQLHRAGGKVPAVGIQLEHRVPAGRPTHTETEPGASAHRRVTAASAADVAGTGRSDMAPSCTVRDGPGRHPRRKPGYWAPCAFRT